MADEAWAKSLNRNKGFGVGMQKRGQINIPQLFNYYPEKEVGEEGGDGYSDAEAQNEEQQAQIMNVQKALQRKIASSAGNVVKQAGQKAAGTAMKTAGRIAVQATAHLARVVFFSLVGSIGTIIAFIIVPLILIIGLFAWIKVFKLIPEIIATI